MKTTSRITISVIFNMVVLLSAQAQSLRNQADIPGGSELDADTRAILQEARRPDNIEPAIWDRMVATYKVMMSRNVEIQFFGRVLDPDDIPIEGVTVRGFVYAYDNAILLDPGAAKSEQKEVDWTATTDKSGMFVVQGLRGVSLHTTAFEKEGYLAPAYDEYFRFSEKQFEDRIFKADADKPIVFRVWPQKSSVQNARLNKKGIKGEGATDGLSLIRKSIKINGQGDGTQYHVDLISGAYSLNEADVFDIVASVSSSPSPASLKSKYDWSFSLSVPDGGIIETEEIHPYRAPTDGYKPVVTCEMPATDAQWRNSMGKKFYVQSRAGAVYALIDVTVYVYKDGKSVVLIDSMVNAIGSWDLMPLQ